jgi:hypothetical protein
MQVDTAMSAKRTADVLAYLMDGGFLDATLTNQLSAQVVTYNPRAGVFG